MAFFVSFLNKQQREFTTKNTFKTPQKKIGGSPCRKLFAQKVERKKSCRLSFFPFDLFLSRFWPFLCMTSSKAP
jgi:hypothetical protein